MTMIKTNTSYFFLFLLTIISGCSNLSNNNLINNFENNHDLFLEKERDGSIYLINKFTNSSELLEIDGGQAKLWGNYIVFMKENWNNKRLSRNIYYYNIQTKKETLLPSPHVNGWTPDIYGNKIVWEEKVGSSYQIFIYDLSTKEFSKIEKDRFSQKSPKIYESNIAYIHSSVGSPNNIFLYNLKTKEKKQITNDSGIEHDNININDKYVVWRNSVTGNPALNYYDIESKEILKIKLPLRRIVRLKELNEGIISYTAMDDLDSPECLYNYDIKEKEEIEISCPTEEAIKSINQNIEFCKTNNKFQEAIEDCYYKTALRYKNVDICQKISNTLLKDRCIFDLSTDLSQSKFCVGLSLSKKVSNYFEECINSENINEQDENGNTALIHSLNNILFKERIDHLLSLNPDVNVQNNLGNTALFEATWTNDIDLVKKLIDLNADVFIKNDLGENALMYAAKKENSHFKDILLSSEGDEYKEVVELLLNNGVNINSQDNLGDTALIKVVKSPKKEHEKKAFIHLFLKLGANPNIKNNNGETALLLISSSRYPESIIKLLIEYDADPSIKDKKNKSAYDYYINSYSFHKYNEDVIDILV
ncbi:hypothetical protein CMO93_02415 [Candidatus Woesearchaeota archaeon]|nr:hypothetical protein [Candidatus Woesearchaeota archaeon]